MSEIKDLEDKYYELMRKFLELEANNKANLYFIMSLKPIIVQLLSKVNNIDADTAHNIVVEHIKKYCSDKVNDDMRQFWEGQMERRQTSQD